MVLKIGFSPCPNDTFIFNALVNQQMDTEGITFLPVLEDVQTLNEWAIEGKLDISKISYGVLKEVLPNYRLLQSGGALGSGVGPLLISAKQMDGKRGDLQDFVEKSTIALPGKHTTAHLLFSKAFPKATKKEFLRFDQIEQFVIEGKGLGVIIHENRFTYKQKGLFCWMDLGAFWEETTLHPIPLGGIVMKKGYENKLAAKVDGLIKKSVSIALAQYPVLPEYVVKHAQTMEEQVMRQHIQLYVNEFSVQLGEKGRAAVAQLMQSAEKKEDIKSDYFWV